MDHRLPVLMGRRVLLREATPADAAGLFACASDPEVTRFLAFDSPRSVDETRAFIGRAESHRRQDREYVFIVADRTTDEPRGVIGLRHLDPLLGTAEIGTWLRQADWGTGLNAEAKGLIFDYAFGPLGLHRLEARIVVGHERSRRAFENLGGVFEGILRESFRKGGVIADQALYAVLAPEWRSRSAQTAGEDERARGGT